MKYKIIIECHWVYPTVQVTTEEYPGRYSSEEALDLIERMAMQECESLNSDGENSFRCQQLGDKYDMATLLWVGDDYQVVTGYNIVPCDN